MSDGVVFDDVTGYFSRDGRISDESIKNKFVSKENFYDKSLLRVRGLDTVRSEFMEAVALQSEIKFVAKLFRDHCNTVMNQLPSNKVRLDLRYQTIQRFKSVLSEPSTYPGFYWFKRNGRTLVSFTDVLDDAKQGQLGMEELWVYYALEYQRVRFEDGVRRDRDLFLRLGIELEDVMRLSQVPAIPGWVEIV